MTPQTEAERALVAACRDERMAWQCRGEDGSAAYHAWEDAVRRMLRATREVRHESSNERVLDIVTKAHI